MDATGLVKAIEALLVGGAVLGFCWWQIRAVRRLQRAREAAERKAAQDPPPAP